MAVQFIVAYDFVEFAILEIYIKFESRAVCDIGAQIVLPSEFVTSWHQSMHLRELLILWYKGCHCTHGAIELILFHQTKLKFNTAPSVEHAIAANNSSSNDEEKSSEVGPIASNVTLVRRLDGIGSAIHCLSSPSTLVTMRYLQRQFIVAVSYCNQRSTRNLCT
jgi:hypothetical protein